MTELAHTFLAQHVNKQITNARLHMILFIDDVILYIQYILIYNITDELRFTV